MTKKKQIFNYRLSRARRTVENAFGILTSKWRILNKAIETNVEHVIIITKSVCVLHNIVQTYDQHHYNQVDHNSEENFVGISDIRGRQNNNFGRLVRDAREIFTEYFSNDCGSVPWQLDFI